MNLYVLNNLKNNHSPHFLHASKLQNLNQRVVMLSFETNEGEEKLFQLHENDLENLLTKCEQIESVIFIFSLLSLLSPETFTSPSLYFSKHWEKRCPQQVGIFFSGRSSPNDLSPPQAKKLGEMFWGGGRGKSKKLSSKSV